MGAPKEVWVNHYGWWVNSYGWHPNGVVFAYRTEVEAARCLQDGGTMARYVLARPKRDAVAWVVRDTLSGCNYLNTDEGWGPRHMASRWRNRDNAMNALSRTGFIHGVDALIVKLARPVKP